MLVQLLQPTTTNFPCHQTSHGRLQQCQSADLALRIWRVLAHLQTTTTKLPCVHRTLLLSGAPPSSSARSLRSRAAAL